MEAASELGEADMEEWTNDLEHEVGQESREKVRAKIHKRMGEFEWQVVRLKGKR